MRVWSVGHSTHTLNRFVALLTAHGIALVADIRAEPRSRRHPWFHSDALAQRLPDHGVACLHLSCLAGWRRVVDLAWGERIQRGGIALEMLAHQRRHRSGGSRRASSRDRH